jgi:hypothetical protein
VLVAVAAAGVGLWPALAAGVFAGWPDVVRVALAFHAVVLAPGFAVVALLGIPAGGAWLAPAFALGLGVAWGAAWLALPSPGRPVEAALLALPAATALLVALAAWRVRSTGSAADRLPALRGVALAAVLAAAALAALHAGTLGTVVTLDSDSPDHVATVRRILETGEPFPAEVAVRTPGVAVPDPRKGWWHAEIALVARLSGLDPVDAWRALAGVLAPFAVLIAAAFGLLVAGGAGAALTAWAALLLGAGQWAWFPLRKLAFGSMLAEPLTLAVVVAVLADLARPTRGSRVTALLLAAAASAVHLFPAVHLPLVLAALGVGLWLRGEEASLRRRFAATALAAAAAAWAVALPRVLATAGPTDPLHGEPQGLLILAKGLAVVSPGVLWDWMGPLWVLFPLSWPALWRGARGRPAVLSLLTTSVAVALCLFLPPLVALLEPRLGYLLMRFVWMLPLAALVAWVALALGQAVAGGRGWKRPAAALLLAALGALLLPVARLALASITRAGGIRAEEAASSPTRWRASLARLDALPGPPRAVLSDPGTSYAVPMLTRHFVVATLDQHGSPRDTAAMARLLDARDALDPWQPWSRLREVVAQREVGAIVLNARFDEPPGFDVWAPTPRRFAAMRARLDAHPDAFPVLFDEGELVAYGVQREALDRLDSPPPPRDEVEPWDPDRAIPVGAAGAGGPELVALDVEPTWAAPGEVLRGVLRWRAATPLPAGSYRTVVRFDTPVPGGGGPAGVSKPVRKLLERLRGERYRFRADLRAAHREYGVDLWRSDEVVRDSFAVRVPSDAAAGIYTVRVAMIRQPHYQNLRLTDYLSDDDLYSGVVAGQLEVRRAGAERP